MFERTTVTSRPDLRRGTASRQFHQELFNNVRDVVVLVALPTSPASIIFGNIEALVEEGSAHRHELGLIRSASTEQPSLVVNDRQSSEVLGKLQLTESQARELNRAVLAADRNHPLLLEMLHNLRTLTHVERAGFAGLRRSVSPSRS